MNLRRLGVVLAVAAVATAAARVLTAWSIPRKLFEPVEERLLDWRVRSVPPPAAQDSRIALVLFDSATVDGWPYLMPFPRAALAELIDVVAASGAKAIALDVYLDRRYPALNAMDGGDEKLRESIRRAGNVILAAPTVQRDGQRVFLPPDPYFAEVAAGVGVADLPTPYETIRDWTVATDAGGRLRPGLALSVWARAHGRNADTLVKRAIATGAIDVPTMPEALRRLPSRNSARPVPLLFRGLPSRPGREDGAFPAFSGGMIRDLGAFTPPELFRDRIVLMGSGFHEEEKFRSPFYDANYPGEEGRPAGWTYGVEVHANALDNLLTGRFPWPAPAWLVTLLVGLCAFLVAAATFRKGTWWGGATAVAVLLASTVASFVAFGTWLVVFPIVTTALATVFAFLGSTSYVSIVEGAEKRAIRGAFSKYVSPAVVAELVADPSRLKLGGEKRHITVLFSDLAGFTSLAETVEPEELLQVLNRYLDAMTRIVITEGGTLDKYIGDAVMALYGAPASLEDHALRACRTALRMQRRLEELNRAWVAEGWRPLSMRVGINSGRPVVGNIGGNDQINYTALGDAVNLAARLEPACKTYGVGIMISGETRAAAGDAVVTRELEVLAVYGKAEPVAVYELVAMAGDDLGGRGELLAQYERGLAAYRARDWDLARAYFRAAAEIDPADAPTLLYLDRCERCLECPPPAEWSYVERRQIK